jgi:cell division protein FtsQ
MFKKFRLRRGVYVILGLLMFLGLIGFVEKKQEDKTCKRILINVNNEFENYFVDQMDVQFMLEGSRRSSLIGEKFSSIDLKYLEKKIETNKFVKDAQIFNDLKGNLVVNIDQMRPLARVINSFGGGNYISTESTILPLSSKFASRVIVISGNYTNKITDAYLQKTKEGRELIEMLQFIENDEFLKAQIAQMEVNEIGEIVIFPQIGKQYIEFGTAENFEIKFRKLKAFYKEILPVKGWGAYQKISLKYQNQIVCE